MTRLAIIVNLVIFLLLSASVFGATWHVEKDGTGDYTSIQPAVDAAAQGDTIYIGPGRYEEYQSVTLPGWSWPIDIYVYIRTADLTIIGAGQDNTIIGPTEQQFISFGPKGVVVDDEWVNNLRITDLATENLYNGVYGHIDFLSVYQCRMSLCRSGITAWTPSGLLVDRCQFNDNTSKGIITYGPTQNAEIRRSIFNNCTTGVSVDSSIDIQIIDCNIIDGSVGIQYANHSTGHILNSEISQVSSVGINVTSYSDVVVVGNCISGGSRNINIINSSHVSGEGNILSGGSQASLLLSKCQIEFNGNHILFGGAYSVLLDFFRDPPVQMMDLSGNYWGTSDSGQISEWIWDGNDDPSILAFVEYEPFSSTPLGSEAKTWGEVKNLYR